MRLQTLSRDKVTGETPWHDAASNGGAYRERLKLSLGGYFEQDDAGEMQPKAEFLTDSAKPFPDALRLVGDDGKVLEAYTLADLGRDTGLKIVAPNAADDPS